jgi:hypothetical protein
VSVVESSRTHTWILLHSPIEGGDDPNTAHPSDRLVFADESQLSRVEIGYVREELEPRAPIGFRLQEATERSSNKFDK